MSILESRHTIHHVRERTMKFRYTRRKLTDAKEHKTKQIKLHYESTMNYTIGIRLQHGNQRKNKPKNEKINIIIFKGKKPTYCTIPPSIKSSVHNLTTNYLDNFYANHLSKSSSSHALNRFCINNTNHTKKARKIRTQLAEMKRSPTFSIRLGKEKKITSPITRFYFRFVYCITRSRLDGR